MPNRIDLLLGGLAVFNGFPQEEFGLNFVAMKGHVEE